jgi:NAD-dependent SIR2 family protein deacetylase
LLRTKQKIVVISGAGISVNAGCESSISCQKEHYAKLACF